MVCIEGRVASASFTVFAILALYQVRIIYGDYWSYIYCLATFGSAFACVLVLPYNDIVKRSALLGTVFGGSFVLMFIVKSPWNVFFMYFAALSFFHFSEYFMTALYNPHRLSIDSFLLNHSFEYKAAAVASWIEFIIEAYFFPSSKRFGMLSFIGLSMIICGEVFRKLAMITAKSNFSHIVQSHKNDGHLLVTNGIYAISRHPAYVGWFIWSVGTQILLFNPICLVGYTYASWTFFNERIFDEEAYLLDFFGEDYAVYMKNVATGIPFIYGCESFIKYD
ncbi:protein-S-isoprenylcysteine O-methyltransferase-like [Clytia hemisphaerica]|uniref:Protein-S-isoprenylcysteine O-methyltransferase n=1 Tax=Clytia hemisphaerica TaxID=252671 RepID=A0A7M5WYV3_9CNID